MPTKSKPAVKTPARPAPKAPVTRQTDFRASANNGVNWESVLDGLASASSGPFFFVKAPKTRMRLVCLDEDITRFYAPATTYFRGKPKTKYVLFASIISSEGSNKGPLSDQWKDKVVPVVITKTALSGIISQLAEGFELFDPEEGYGITITRSGSGTDTDYNITCSPHPIPLDINGLEMPEKTLVEYADDLTSRSASRNGGESDADGKSAPSDW